MEDIILVSRLTVRSLTNGWEAMKERVLNGEVCATRHSVMVYGGRYMTQSLANNVEQGWWSEREDPVLHTF